MNLQEIKDKLTTSGKRFEIGKTDPIHGTTFGVELAKDCWSWFRLSSRDFIFFDHTYSQNTGKSKKGVRHALNKMDALERIGINDHKEVEQFRKEHGLLNG